MEWGFQGVSNTLLSLTGLLNLSMISDNNASLGTSNAITKSKNVLRLDIIKEGVTTNIVYIGIFIYTSCLASCNMVKTMIDQMAAIFKLASC
jgi:hypothetical protein